jgi:energy-converting hydrogenase Eha subunit A
MTGQQPAPAPAQRADVRHRSWLEIRWRQFRNAPRPVVRAVLSSLVVALVLGFGYLAYDLAIRRGASLPGGDLRTLYLVAYIAIVLIVGSVVTWLVVPQPRGSGDRTTRSAWSAALGFFAAVPVCYLVLVLVVQILEPLIS